MAFLDVVGEHAHMPKIAKRMEASAGSVLFRGALPPRPETLEGLERAGVVLTPEPATEGLHWSARARHAEWGECTIQCLRNRPPPVPEVVLRHDPRLTEEEKKLARMGQSSVTVRREPSGADVLRERKLLLRFLDATAGNDGLVAIDHLAQAFWSRTALAEELAHDADLDILAIFTAHVIFDPGSPPHWVHTHGLAELGFFDFDVLDPSTDMNDAWELMRAVAFTIVEEKAAAGGDGVPIVGGMPPLHLVDARNFLQQSGKDHPRWMASLDDTHLDRHCIVCDPPSRRLFGLFGSRCRPWSAFNLPSLEGAPVYFTTLASDLMGARARATLSVFCRLREEFADLELPALVKLRYERRADGQVEHLWFVEHESTADRIEATLINDPFGDVGLRKGERRVHSTDRLSDWSIMTPVGTITPRDLMNARALRENKDEIAAVLKKSRASKRPP
jgi:hypothetical protein